MVGWFKTFKLLFADLMLANSVTDDIKEMIKVLLQNSASFWYFIY